jgi:hypothetical protein
MIHYKLVHKDPNLNETTRWYRMVGESQDWYFCTIWGREGFINSHIHAVPKSDYTLTIVKEKEGNRERPESADEFF